MNKPVQNGQLEEALQQSLNLWKTRGKGKSQSPSSPPFTIALSRESGTSGSVVAREVGKRLGWPVYDHELLELIASDIGVQTKLLESLDERRSQWMQEIFQSFMGISYVSEAVYFHRLVKTVLALGSHGECVIVGRGATFILPTATTFRIRLVAPQKYRIEEMGRLMPQDETIVKEKMLAQDKERIGFVRAHFSQDPELSQNFDLVINRSRFSPVECAEFIVQSLSICQNRV